MDRTKKIEKNIKPYSFHLQWHITERCNLHCKHCYQNPDFIKQELSFLQLKEILEKFLEQIKKWNIPKERVRISVTGGEPMIRKDFFDFLELLHKNNSFIFYGVLTNGIFLDKENVKKIKDSGVNYVQLSLEGLEKTNDEIRGKGTFKKIIKAAKLLKEEGISVNFSTTITKINFKEIPALLKLSKEMGIFLSVRRMVTQGNAKGLEKDLLNAREIRMLWHYIFEANKESGNNCVGIGCEDGMLVQDFPKTSISGCSAGYMSFTVLPNGDVYPCRRLPIFSGNILKNSFEDIYFSKIFQDLRNINNVNDVCYNCPYYQRCLGGAKCLSLGFFNDYTAPDPNCWRLFEKLPNPKVKWKNSYKKRDEKLNERWFLKK